MQDKTHLQMEKLFDWSCQSVGLFPRSPIHYLLLFSFHFQVVEPLNIRLIIVLNFLVEII